MRCDEIMERDYECVSPRDTVVDAATRMRDEGIGFLPVCDESRKVLGTLTDRDIAVRLVAGGKSGDTLVEDVMTSEVIACRSEDDIGEAEQLMAQNHKSRMLCVDDEGRLEGVLSLSDIAKYEGGDRASDTLRRISEREARV